MKRSRILTVLVVGLVALVPAPGALAQLCVLPSGMVAWYPFNEECGSTAGDLLGGNDGAHQGNPAPVSASVGYGLHFDGNDYVQAPDASALDIGSNDFSIAFWITTTQSSGTWVIQDKRKSTYPYTGYHVHLNNGKIAIQLANSGGYTNYVSTAYVANGSPHFVVIPVDRDSTGKFYVDGSLASTFNPTSRTGSLANSVPLRFGRRSFSSASYFQGTLDEWQLYGRALSSGEVANMTNPGTCDSPPAPCRTAVSCGSRGAVYMPGTAWQTDIRFDVETLMGVSGSCGTDSYAGVPVEYAQYYLLAAIEDWNKALTANGGFRPTFIYSSANPLVTMSLGKNVNGLAAVYPTNPGSAVTEVRIPPACYGNSVEFFYNVMLHELGHVFGLRHFPAKPGQNLLLCGTEEEPDSVMYTGNSIAIGDVCTVRSCLKANIQ